MKEQHFRVEIWASQLPCKVSVTCPVNASGSVWQELFPSNLFSAQKKWKLYKNHQLFKMTESSVIKINSAALFTFVKVKFTKRPKLLLFEITQQSIGWKKKQLTTNNKSLKNTACMSAWNSTGPLTLDKFNLCWDNSVHITAPWPRVSSPSHWWLEVTSVHVGTHNYHFPTGGGGKRWSMREWPSPLCAPPSKSDNKLVHLASPTVCVI